MLDAVLYFFLTLVFTVILLFVFTVVSAKNAVRRRDNNPIIISDDPHSESDNDSDIDEVENTPEYVRHSDSIAELRYAYDTMPEEYTDRGHHQHILDLQRKFSSASSSSESSRRSSNAAKSLFQMMISDKKLDEDDHQEAMEMLTRDEEDGEEPRRTSWPLLKLRKRKSRQFSLRIIPE